jgi:hypothetical protein
MFLPGVTKAGTDVWLVACGSDDKSARCVELICVFASGRVEGRRDQGAYYRT